MTNKSQQEEEKQFQLPEEVEKRFQDLEKKKEEAKSDNHPYAASAADSGQGQGQGCIEQVNTADSQQEISACFEAAIKKLDKIESDANKKKSEIIRELTHDLEGKMPTDEIAAEIVHQLRGRISERRIYECLEGEQYAKYKKKHRVENARKRQARKDQAELAAEPQLKEEVAVQASGQEAVLKPTRSPEENLSKTQEVGSGDDTLIDTDTSSPQPEQSVNTNASVPTSMTAPPTSPQSIDEHMTGEDSKFPGPRDKSPVCKNCSIKDNRIKKLEDENRELSVHCSCAESSNSKLLLKLTAQENYINRLLEEEQDLSHSPDKYIVQECQSCSELEEKVIELSEALKHTSMRTPDEIPASEIVILQEKYDTVRDAMDKSKGAIFVKIYGKKFARAMADVDN